MTDKGEFVISLGRLLLPEGSNVKRLTIAILAPPDELYIQNDRCVRNSKVNFYRENIFLSVLHAGFRFRLYQVDASGKKTVLKELEVSSKELMSVGKRAAVFKTAKDGFELIWESWLFSEGSSDCNQMTEKDYSELELPFQNREDSGLSQILINSRSHQPTPRNSRTKKRSGSTSDSSHRRHAHQNIAEHVKPHFEMEEEKHRVRMLRPRATVVACSVDRKRRPNLKSHLYSYLVSGISSLFSTARTT